jgi:hypothetical protein
MQIRNLSRFMLRNNKLLSENRMLRVHNIRSWKEPIVVCDSRCESWSVTQVVQSLSVTHGVKSPFVTRSGQPLSVTHVVCLERSLGAVYCLLLHASLLGTRWGAALRLEILARNNRDFQKFISSKRGWSFPQAACRGASADYRTFVQWEYIQPVSATDTST